MDDNNAFGQAETSPVTATRPSWLLQLAVSAALLASVLFIVFKQTELADVSNIAFDISLGPIALAFGALLMGVLLAAARVKLVAEDLGYRLSWRDACSALGFSQLGGAFFFQLAGQLIARGAYLSRRGIPVGASVAMVGYERLLAFGISLMLATIGAWHLFGRIAIDLENGGFTFMKVLVGVLLAILSGAWLGWGRSVARRINERLGTKAVWRIARVGLLSLGIQLATVSAYVIIGGTLAPDIPKIDLVAASFIVMLAAAVPISLAGWGVREFSAILALGAIGVPPSAAFLIAILIGTGALIAVAPLTALGLGGRSVARSPLPGKENQIDYNFLISLIIPLVVATAVFFQLYLPTTSGGLNVNLADPFAILGGALFLIYFVVGRASVPDWRLTYFNIHILASLIALTVSLLIGAARHGWTDWALVNKYGGWFVLLAYGASGALIVKAMGPRGLRLLLMTFVAAGASIAAIELLLLAARSGGIEMSYELLWHDPRGFSQNQNAFAFQMLMVVSSVVALTLPRMLSTVLLAIALTAVWATGSRAGLGALFVVLALALYVRAITPKNLAIALLAALGLVSAIVLLELPELLSGTESFLHWDLRIFRLTAITSIGGDRMASILGGIELFLAHPFLGSGLGSFLNGEIQLGRPPLVIHSTPLWLLAEMGLVGMLILAAPVFRIFLSEIRRETPDISALLLVCIIGGFGAMSLLHEMLYQRTFWLLLGAALASQITPRRDG